MPLGRVCVCVCACAFLSSSHLAGGALNLTVCACGSVRVSVACLVFAENLASAKEENVGIHQVLDQTLLELNNL